jgi:hypothetical protein
MSERRRTPGLTPTALHIAHEKASVTPREAARFLVVIVLSLTALSLLGQVAVHLKPDFAVRDRFAATFNVDEEGNPYALLDARHTGLRGSVAGHRQDRARMEDAGHGIGHSCRSSSSA